MSQRGMANTVYQILYSLFIPITFISILFVGMTLFLTPFLIPIVFYSHGKSILVAYLLWAIVMFFILHRLRPWDADSPEALRMYAEEYKEMLLICPLGCAYVEGNIRPYHHFPWFWRSYCPDCQKRIHVHTWNTYRYCGCECGYKWAAQDNWLF